MQAISVIFMQSLPLLKLCTNMDTTDHAQQATIAPLEFLHLKLAQKELTQV